MSKIMSGKISRRSFLFGSALCCAALLIPGCSSGSTGEKTAASAPSANSPSPSPSTQAVSYPLQSINADISDVEGYTYDGELKFGPWITDVETAKAVFKQIAGSSKSFPTPYSFQTSGNSFAKLTENDLAYAIGSLSYSNTTSGFSFTESNPRTVNVPISVMRYSDSKDDEQCTVMMLLYYSSSEKCYGETPNAVATEKMNDGRTSAGLGFTNGTDTPNAKMTKDSWGPCYFVLATENKVTPNNPNGTGHLNELAIGMSNVALVEKHVSMSDYKCSNYTYLGIL